MQEINWKKNKQDVFCVNDKLLYNLEAYFIGFIQKTHPMQAPA